MHDESHPLAGKTVILNSNTKDTTGEVLPGVEYQIEEYWDKLTGKSWMHSDGNPAAMKYAIRAGFTGLPVDDEVVYGKIGSLGHLVHVSELGDVKE